MIINILPAYGLLQRYLSSVQIENQYIILQLLIDIIDE